MKTLTKKINSPFSKLCNWLLIRRPPWAATVASNSLYLLKKRSLKIYLWLNFCDGTLIGQVLATKVSFWAAMVAAIVDVQWSTDPSEVSCSAIFCKTFLLVPGKDSWRWCLGSTLLTQKPQRFCHLPPCCIFLLMPFILRIIQLIDESTLDASEARNIRTLSLFLNVLWAIN